MTFIQHTVRFEGNIRAQDSFWISIIAPGEDAASLYTCVLTAGEDEGHVFSIDSLAAELSVRVSRYVAGLTLPAEGFEASWNYHVNPGGGDVALVIDMIGDSDGLEVGVQADVRVAARDSEEPFR